MEEFKEDNFKEEDIIVAEEDLPDGIEEIWLIKE